MNRADAAPIKLISRMRLHNIIANETMELLGFTFA